MVFFKKKINPRRQEVRKGITAERASRLKELTRSGIPASFLLLVLFVWATVTVTVIDTAGHQVRWKTAEEIIWTAVIIALASAAAGFYIFHYQGRILKNHLRGIALAGLFIILLSGLKLGLMVTNEGCWSTATAVTCAIILAIAYEQRFALGMSLFFAFLASLSLGMETAMGQFLVMSAAIITCCFSLREIRTRMKLLEVSTFAAVIVFVISMAVEVISGSGYYSEVLPDAGKAAGVTVVVGLVIQSLLPVIEKAFGIATSMTLLDYSDANQPLLKRLAMEAPGTYSHCLLIGSIAESAAESIGANGLLCRVGAYYHDIGKINKPGYFVENQMGSISRHTELSPAMSQLIIVGHVKDGIEMAKEYRLPAVLRQFAETHHGTTLVEYFYNEAKKKSGDKKAVPSETEFRYPGPKPQTKEAAIVMLADAVESAVRSLGEVTLPKIEAVVHNMAVRRLRDGQFDECDLTLRELSQIESNLAKSLMGHHHGRIAYPKRPDLPESVQEEREEQAEKDANE